MFCMKTGPFSKNPATMNVAPVSDIDLANARMKLAISDGFMMEKVTVLDAVNGGAPRVRAAFSYSLL